MQKNPQRFFSLFFVILFYFATFNGLNVGTGAVQIYNKALSSENSDVRFIYIDDQDRLIVLPQEDSYRVQPFVLDIDDDSLLETVIVADMGGTQGKIVYLIKDESVASGWPLILYWDMNDIEILGRMDLNNGTDPRIIIRYTKDILDNITTSFIAIDVEGKIDVSWGFELPGSFISHTIVSDLNKDGNKEFVLIDKNETVYYLDNLGNNMMNWPMKVNDSTNFIPPVVEDITNDGEKEIIVTTDKGFIYAWFLNGSIIEGFPLKINVTYPVFEEFREMPMISDFNLDGDVDLFIASTDGYMYGITLDSENNKTWAEAIPNSVYTTQGISYDIDNDGQQEILQLLYNGLAVYNVTESINLEFYFDAGSNYIGSPAIADIDGDNEVEIIIMNTIYAYILEHDGEVLEQIPNWITTANKISPIVYDIDRDNEIEIVHLSLGGVILIKETNDFGIAPWVYPLGSPTHTSNTDLDEDGLLDFEEEIIGTDVNNSDTDGDTVLDGLEVNQYVLNPQVPDIDWDSDSDGLTNMDEIDVYLTNPLNPDSDFDTLSDGDEIYVYFTSPFSSDSDEDGMPDNYEILYDSHDPNDPTDAQEDPDNDNLINLDERAMGTHPENPDTDGDSLLDGDEIDRYYTNPLQPDADFDMDGDGLTNVEEVDIYGTNPGDPDSDQDGYTDKEEINAKSDPLDPNSIPKERSNNWMYSFIAIVPIVILTPIYVRRLYSRRLLK
ncbi:MAG: hypothetical protein H7644_07175 [Candidatus Heimdallarchaeota archaeon]|nr:hypothetical protein [Candidatus Heimdallarchaeota archaeon]MCK5143531.1 hypothetical protein [Candidatus Heimdallarchaeota archaeon]